MTKENLERVKAKVLDYKRWRWGNDPKKNLISKWVAQTNTTNGLTNFVIFWFRLHGWHAEKTGNQGFYDVKAKKYRPGSGTRGTSDVKAVADGKTLAIEIKNKKTKDIMSPYQRAYSKIVENAKGNYDIITDADQFLVWYDSKGFGENPDKLSFWQVAKEYGDTGKKYVIA